MEKQSEKDSHCATSRTEISSTALEIRSFGFSCFAQSHLCFPAQFSNNDCVTVITTFPFIISFRIRAVLVTFPHVAAPCTRVGIGRLWTRLRFFLIVQETAACTLTLCNSSHLCIRTHLSMYTDWDCHGDKVHTRLHCYRKIKRSFHRLPVSCNFRSNNVTYTTLYESPRRYGSGEKRRVSL